MFIITNVSRGEDRVVTFFDTEKVTRYKFTYPLDSNATFPIPSVEISHAAAVYETVDSATVSYMGLAAVQFVRQFAEVPGVDPELCEHIAEKMHQIEKNRIENSETRKQS